MTWIAFFSALWLGILTAISPCPLAANIAAISFIGRKPGQKNHAVQAGFLYSVGRTLAYVILGMVVAGGLLGSSEISRFLQEYMNEILGPVLIVLGLVLLGWVGSDVSFYVGTQKLQEKAKKGGILWAVPLGFMFALSFCPVSAGLFFGGLLPLAVKQGSIVVLPVVYGIGTALPVVAFAFITAFGAAYLGKAFNRLSQLDAWIRALAGTAFILVGLYYCLTYIYC